MRTQERSYYSLVFYKLLLVIGVAVCVFERAHQRRETPPSLFLFYSLKLILMFLFDFFFYIFFRYITMILFYLYIFIILYILFFLFFFIYLLKLLLCIFLDFQSIILNVIGYLFVLYSRQFSIFFFTFHEEE